MNCELTKNESDLWQCQNCGWVFPSKTERPPFRNCPNKIDGSGMPGNILHRLLRDRIGMDATKKCQCDKNRILMNMWGPAGCRENLDWIVSEMLSEAQKRNWTIDGNPLLTIAAKVGTKLPGGMMFARSWARALVLEAIEMSEKEPTKAG